MDFSAFLTDIAGFALKALIVAGLIAILAVLIAGAFRQVGSKHLGHLTVINLNSYYRSLSGSLERAAFSKKERKSRTRSRKKESGAAKRKRVYLLKFEGDLAATEVAELREQITALASVVEKTDEVVALVESSGGLMTHYGLAASQLNRLRAMGVPLTVCVDKVAASGGYMMACVADKIVAAPFALVGSIGVMAMMPNFNRLLKKYDVDYLELTAGEYKRTLTPLGEITDKGKRKFLQDLEDAHRIFKDFLAKHRPSLELEKVATGEAWSGVQALPLKLVDELMTSDEYLLAASREADIFRLEYEAPKSLKDKLAGSLTESADRLLLRWRERFEKESGPRV